jgi:YggT family protein
MMNPVFWLILQLLDIYTWIVIAAVVASWLIAFNVVNLHNAVVRSIVRVLDVLTEPVFRQVRRVLPSFGGIDLSPIVVFLGIMFIRYVIIYISATWMI